MSLSDGPTTTETATIRIGEGVNLTAVDDKPPTVAPGGAVTLRPRVRNGGPTAVDGLTAVINADQSVVAGTEADFPSPAPPPRRSPAERSSSCSPGQPSSR